MWEPAPFCHHGGNVGEQREERITLRLTADERRLVALGAGRVGEPESTFVRRAALLRASTVATVPVPTDRPVPDLESEAVRVALT